VYIHEFIDIIGHHRAEYMYHMTANWGPIGRAERDQLCFGVWGVVGSTGAWPQVVNLWEYRDWDALGHNFEVELTGAGLQDPSLDAWWAKAAGFRSGGVDRILVAAEWSPSVADHAARFDVPPAGYVHELVRCRPGAATEMLENAREVGVPAHAAAGLTLVGAFRRALADDDECLFIWSFPAWSVWSAFEAAEIAGTGDAAAWRRDRRDIVTAGERILLADAPLSPLRLGRQPDVTDRGPTHP